MTRQVSDLRPSCTTIYSPEEGYVIITLSVPDKSSEGLRFRFVSGWGADHVNDPRFLEAASILAKCTHFTPIGFKVIDALNLRVEYEPTQPNLLATEHTRLVAYDDFAHSAMLLRERIDEICKEQNIRFKTDPKSLIVSRRVYCVLGEPVTGT